MTNIKTYPQVNKNDTSLTFEVSKMQTSYSKRKGKKGIPHRHDFYTIILVEKAQGLHIIDFNEYPLSDQQVFFVSPGQVHQVIENVQSFGYSLTFSVQFLINNNIPLSFINDLNLFNDYGNASPLLVTSIQLEKLTKYSQEILECYNSDMKFKEQAIGANLKLFLIECNNLCIKPNETEIFQAGYSILKNFKDAVEEFHKDWHSTVQYANYLNITPDHLNRIIKSLIGKTAKEYIQIRISVAAKRLLFFSDLSAKEIGFQLGFSEASNFSTFFKKWAKVSPSNFRKNR